MNYQPCTVYCSTLFTNITRKSEQINGKTQLTNLAIYCMFTDNTPSVSERLKPTSLPNTCQPANLKANFPQIPLLTLLHVIIHSRAYNIGRVFYGSTLLKAYLDMCD